MSQLSDDDNEILLVIGRMEGILIGDRRYGNIPKDFVPIIDLLCAALREVIKLRKEMRYLAGER